MCNQSAVLEGSHKTHTKLYCWVWAGKQRTYNDKKVRLLQRASASGAPVVLHFCSIVIETHVADAQSKKDILDECDDIIIQNL